MNRLSAALALLATPILGACSARQHMSEITGLQPGAAVDGVPVRVRDTFTLRVYQWDPVKTEYVDVYAVRSDLADPERVFAINFRAEALANHEFTLTLNEDGTMDSTTIKSEPQAADVLSKTADATKSVAQAALDQQKAQIANELDALQKKETIEDAKRKSDVDYYSKLAAVADADSTVFAAQQDLDKAQDDLTKAQHDLSNPPAGSNLTDLQSTVTKAALGVQAKEQLLLKAEQTANSKYVAAGLPPKY